MMSAFPGRPTGPTDMTGFAGPLPSDRRRHPRLVLCRPADVALVDRVVPAAWLDISASGCGLGLDPGAAPAGLACGLVAVLDLGPSAVPARFLPAILRRVERSGPRLRLGLEFPRLKPLQSATLDALLAAAERPDASA